MKRDSQPPLIPRIFSWLRQPWHAVYTGLLAAVLIAFVVLHYRASYTFPLPWPDEAHFIWQANAFAERFSLFAPELNADRTIFWMPPGYFLALGTIIRLFGLSLDVARTFSLALMLAVIVMIAVLVRHYSLPLLSLLLAVPFVLGAPFVACGNIARMEALLLSVLLAAFLFLQRRKIIVGLCLLALAPLIHPNGVYFLISGIVAAAVARPRPWVWRRPTTGEAIVIAAAVLAWVGYGVYASLHWTDFVHDMAFQFERKAARNIRDAVLTVGSVSLLVMVVLGAVYCYWKKLPVVFLLVIAIPAWWVAAAGIEMWYRVFFSLSYYVLAVFFLVIVYHLVQGGEARWRKIVFPALVGLAASAVIGWNVMTSSFGEPLVFPDSKPWYKMTMKAEPYMTESDVSKLRGMLDGIARQKDKPVVEFYPAADAFFFTAPNRPAIQFSYPLFSTRQPDWYLVHASVHFTPAFDRYAWELLTVAQVKPAELPRYFVYSRGKTEQWFLIPGVNNLEYRR